MASHDCDSERDLCCAGELTPKRQPSLPCVLAQDLEFLLQAGGICGQIGGAVGTLLTALLVSQNMFSHLDP